MSKYAVVLAGGFATKYWPISTEKSPKQFTHVYGDGTCIQNTYERLLQYYEKEKIYIVASYSHREIIKEQLSDIDAQNIIYEPFGKGTAPATALAIEYLLQNGADNDSLVAVFPSDHSINNNVEFYNSLDYAYEAANKLSSISTIGLTPDRPVTQYGYIQVNTADAHSNIGKSNVFKCETFAEKPDEGTAIRFVESGDFLWNSGIFVCKVSTFKQSYKKYLPEYYEGINSVFEYYNTNEYVEKLNYHYKQINPISLDYGILEKASNVVCIKGEFTWSDLGNWDELYRIQLKDANNNVLLGDIISIDNKNCLVNSSGKLIALVGVEDLIVIDSGGTTLICKRGEADRVQEIVDFLRRNHINKYL